MPLRSRSSLRSTPDGIRTRVAALKERSARPLHYGGSAPTLHGGTRPQRASTRIGGVTNPLERAGRSEPAPAGDPVASRASSPRPPSGSLVFSGVLVAGSDVHRHMPTMLHSPFDGRTTVACPTCCPPGLSTNVLDGRADDDAHCHGSASRLPAAAPCVGYAETRSGQPLSEETATA